MGIDEIDWPRQIAFSKDGTQMTSHGPWVRGHNLPVLLFLDQKG